MTNLGLKGDNGGLTVYYIPPYDGKTKVTAFKPVSDAFQLCDGMLSGCRGFWEWVREDQQKNSLGLVV